MDNILLNKRPFVQVNGREALPGNILNEACP